MSRLFQKARAKMISPSALGPAQPGSINVLTDTIVLLLIDTSIYAVDLNQHEFLSSVPSAARASINGSDRSDPLTNKTAHIGSGVSYEGGIFDADDLILLAVTGNACGAVIVVKDTGNDATSSLIDFIDQGDFPIVPTGGPIPILFSNGPNRIFRI